MSAESRLNSAGPLSVYLSERSEPAGQYPSLNSDIHADVAIIGAGFTGLSCALTLAEQGFAVSVLEAEEPGYGASGRAWGQVAAAAKFMPARVEKDFSAPVAARINLAAETAPDAVFDLVRKHGIQCDAIRTGNIIAAHNPAKAQWVRNTARDLQARGYPVHLLDGEQTRQFTGSPRYQCALLDERGGALNPLGYARGLARAASLSGAKIYSKTPVNSMVRQGDHWRVSTVRGSVTADQIVFATGAFTENLSGSFTGKEIMPLRAYQAISEPLPANVISSVLPGGQPLNDTRRMFSGVRLWPDGRLHVGVDGPLFRANAYGWLSEATRRLRMMFPQIRTLNWEHHWAGWIDMTADHYPRLHRIAPGVFTGYGFSGRGVAIATLMGRDLANLVMDGDEALRVHPVSEIRPLWYHNLHRPLVSTLTAGYRLEDRMNDIRFGRPLAAGLLSSGEK